MSDRTCNICNTKFKFPSQLERHFSGKKKCKPLSLNYQAICEYCEIQYSNKYNLSKHQTGCKAKLQAIRQTLSNSQVNAIVENNNNAIALNNTNMFTKNEFMTVVKEITETSKTSRKALESSTKQFEAFTHFLIEFGQIFATDNKNPKLLQIAERINKLTGNMVDDNNDNNSYDNNLITQSANTLNNILNPAVNNITNTSNTSNTVSNISNISNIQNIQNNTIQNIQNTQNNVVNNNHLPNIIYPFDYEDISFITDDEKLNILTSYNGVELALEKIYSKPENRNFFRQNSNKDNISILGKDMKVQIKNIKQFNEQILNKGVLLMERMFYTCKNRLAFSDQLLIWNNIEKNRELLGYEYNLVNIMNMIETYFRDPISKDIFKKFSDKLCREETYRKDKINVMKDLIIELERFNQDKTNVTINDDFLRQEVWSQEEAKSKEADGDNIKNNLNLVRVEETPRFKFFIDMRKEEIEYFDMHGASIGNIIKYRSILLQRAKEEIDRINRLYNNDALGDEVRTKLINQTNSDMMSHLQNIKFNNDVGVDADVDIELVNTITES